LANAAGINLSRGLRYRDGPAVIFGACHRERQVIDTRLHPNNAWRICEMRAHLSVPAYDRLKLEKDEEAKDF